MSGHLRFILTLGLALTLGGCAAAPPLTPSSAARNPGEGFTNSNLRTALYEWPADNLAVKNVCLRNSLVIFSLLQQCGKPAQGEVGVGEELVFQDCALRKDERRASFLVQAEAGPPWSVTVGFSEAAQLFSLAATPSQKK